MEPNQSNSNSQKPKGSAKDFFLNLGAFVALYTVIVSLLNLLFTIINTTYPQINYGYNYYGSQSISWPVAILIIFFPLFILLMWILAKDYTRDPEKKNVVIRRWLTYITLFASGLTLAVDLVAVLYYFIDGQELTTGFILKILSVLVVALAVFLYYISDIRGKLTPFSRMIWRVIAFVIIVGSIVWGFSVLGSPRTQRLYKYDSQKISDLQNINSQIQNYYQIKISLPASTTDLSGAAYFSPLPVDPQTQKPYEYKKTGNTSYEVCAEFNKDSSNSDHKTRPYVDAMPYGGGSWTHPVGRYCFPQTINPAQYPPIKLPI